MTGLARQAWGRLRSQHPGQALDSVLARASSRAPFAERLLWLAALARWVTRPDRPAAGEGPGPAARLRFLLSVLERQPAWKTQVARALRSILRDVDVLDVYAESALTQEPGVWSELLELLLRRLVPDNPFAAELGHLLAAVFPGDEHAAFVERIDDESLAGLTALLLFDQGPDEAGWDRLDEGALDALLWLVGDVRTTGLSLPIRKRLGAGAHEFRSLAFFRIAAAADALAAALRLPGAEVAAARASFEGCLDSCGAAIVEVRRHLDEYGVSLQVVYRLDRLEAALLRLRALLDLLSGADPQPRRHARFLARLVRDAATRRSAGGLLSANFRLLAKRVVDRTAEVGERYIARDRSEYAAMLRAAAGGGAVTAVTTIVKLLIYRVPAAPFVTGALVSLNYAASFVAIQLAHFTLATKQPASTAPALAARMHRVREPHEIEALVDEVAHLILSQAAGIFGNVALVAPCAVLLVLPYQALAGRPFLDEAKARYTLESLSLLGGSPVFAALTGVLLWLSSLVAGGADNWFALRGLRVAIAHHPRLAFVLGPRRAERVAAYIDDHIAALAGNTSLGVLLGMAPVVFAFLGLPLDIRHVTLASGQLAAAVASLGGESLATAGFWLAVAGIAVIGVLNVGVSFGLAMVLAIRARDVEAPSRRALRQALLRRMLQRPGSFLFPGPGPASGPGPFVPPPTSTPPPAPPPGS